MTTRIPPRLLSAWCGCWLLWAACPAPAGAEEVRWRQDYGRARQEAVEKVRPLVIDLSTDNCFWCKQLDARTFSDPEVAGLLNERCIPLRVNAQQYPQLAEALQIRSYPTLVFASPEGKILGYQEGFLEAPALQEQLRKVLATLTAPEWMTRDFQDATRAVEAGDSARALGLLRNVVEDGRDRPVQVRSRQLIQELEQQAAHRCARARQLADKGQVQEAQGELGRLLKGFPGTPASREARQVLLTLTSRGEPEDRQRVRRARELLDRAREDYRAQQFLCCLDRCEALLSGYPDLPESAEAGQLAAEIKGNPEWAKQACDQLGDRLSLLYLALADSWLRKGQPQQAVFYLERVLQTCPNTRHAEAAQARLMQLQGPGARAAEAKREDSGP